MEVGGDNLYPSLAPFVYIKLRSSIKPAERNVSILTASVHQVNISDATDIIDMPLIRWLKSVQ